MLGCVKMKFFYSTIALVRRSYSSKTPTFRTTKLATSSISKPKLEGHSVFKWTDEQSEIISEISNGKSVFITGSAGTGKSFLLNHIVEMLKDAHGSSKVFVTASTGVAACALSGQTLHSFAGVGLGVSDKEELLRRVLSYKKALNRWKKVKVLVIDEISMIQAGFFDSLEYIARGTRSKHKVWGGIQLVVSGDFLQLPPVDAYNSSMKLFAFEADCWNSTFDLQIELTTVFRQVDEQLVKLLQGLRIGNMDPYDLQLLQQCSSVVKGPVDPSMLQLFPRIQDVNRVNTERMKILKEEEEITTFNACDKGKDPWKQRLKQGIAPDSIELCKGARVMLIRNLNTKGQLVNGATGTILHFEKNPCDATVPELNRDNLLPVVKFDSGLTEVIRPEIWEVGEGDVVYAKRLQIPLILAWALSIHKCQGMTLDKLHTDLSRAFGCGMVYVALSRLRSLDGLYLSGFNSCKVKADPKVLQYYQRFGNQQKENEEMLDDATHRFSRH